MKKLILSALIIAALTSCKKLNDVLPEQTTPDNNTVTNPAPTAEEAALLTTLPVTPVVYNTNAQVVTTSVTDNKLNLAFDEKVQLLIDKERFNSSWYIVFNEDYTGSYLEGLDFKTTTQWGVEVENWKPYNLHQIDKTVSDTTIGSKKVVNVKFVRKFNFYKVFETNEQAVAKQNELKGKTQPIKFLTRYQPDTDTTRFQKVTVNITYQNQK
jgi:hypothetical protein